MAIERTNPAANESPEIVRIGSPVRRGDIRLTNSPFLYWEGEEINVSQLMRDFRTGLRNRYGTHSLSAGIFHMVKEIFSSPQNEKSHQ